jgi:phospholipid/cholesterol/gamma-HCH transport system substrate-binding protein
METRAHYVAVGAFVLMMVFLAFVAILWLAGTQFSTSFAHYDIYFEGPVTGLSQGGRVEYNGIPVGTVSDIEIITDPKILAENGRKPIRVTIEVKANTPIKKLDAATIQTNILSGVSYILIEPGKSEELLQAQRGERYPVIRSKRATLAGLAARGPQLLDKLGDILDHVDDLLNDQNRQAFSTALANVEKLSGDLAQHSSEIATNAGDALKAAASLFTNLDNGFSQPGGLKEQALASLGDFDRLVKGLSDTNRDIQVTLRDVQPGVKHFSQQTLGDVDSLVGETRQFVAGLSRFVAQIEHDPTRLLFGDRREGYQPK